MKGYHATIASASQQLTKKQSVMLKDLSSAQQLDALTEDGKEVEIHPDIYAEISVHNEHSEDKDYNKYVILDANGTKYVTGSESFWTAFMEIMEDMKDETEEWTLVVYKQPSKNYKGKGFLTCYIK